jgi:hypothetical protein
MMKNKIQHTTKVGIKKKIDLIQEPKQNKHRMVTEKKPPLKSNLIVQMKALQQEFDTLKLENEKNQITIKIMEEKLSQKSSMSIKSKGSQTFAREIQICCNVCIYVATCEEQLNWHMGYEHDLSDESYFDKEFYCDVCSRWFDIESNMLNHRKEHEKKQQHGMSNDDDKLCCNFCDESFSTKRELMRHKKTMHIENVAICRQYATGTCDFGDQYCWFSHCKSKQNHEVSIFKCKSCEKEFIFQSDCLKHRKQEHTNSVPPCRNERNGTCRFGSLNCWFNHTNLENSNKGENSEHLEQINEKLIEKSKGENEKKKT